MPEFGSPGLTDTGLTDTEPKWTHRHQHNIDLPTPDLPTQAIITGGLTDTSVGQVCAYIYITVISLFFYLKMNLSTTRTLSLRIETSYIYKMKTNSTSPKIGAFISWHFMAQKFRFFSSYENFSAKFFDYCYVNVTNVSVSALGIIACVSKSCVGKSILCWCR
jgi:hypothetical protein